MTIETIENQILALRNTLKVITDKEVKKAIAKQIKVLKAKRLNDNQISVYPTTHKNFMNSEIFHNYVNHVFEAFKEDLENISLITKQKSKLNAFHFSLIQFYSCPSNTAPKSFLDTGVKEENYKNLGSCQTCYTLKETMYLNKNMTMKKKILAYALTIKKYFKLLEKILINSIEKNYKAIMQSGIFRFNEAGDIISLEFLMVLLAVAKRFPEIKFFTYTHTTKKDNKKLFDAIIKANKEVKNFNCLFSIDDINYKQRLKEASKHQINLTYFGNKEKKQVNKDFNTKFINCLNQKNDSIKCDVCKLCTKPKNIYFNMH